jgi:hypothetical protein
MSAGPDASLSRPGSSRRPRRGRRALVAVIVVIVVLAILAVIAEIVVRHVAESEAEKRIDSSLPSGTTGSIGVKLEGFSVIVQLLHGSLDDMRLTSHDLVVQNVPVSITAHAADVPLSEGASTGPITAAFTVDQKALNSSKLLKDASGNIALGRGTFSYDSAISILGLKLQYKLTARPSVADEGKQLVLTPTGAAITSSNSTIDVSSLLTYLKSQPPKVCIASQLPDSARLSRVDVVPGSVTFHLRSTGLPLSESALTSKGSC